MPTNKKKIGLASKAWNRIIAKERKALSLSELEFSALSAWLVDCFESYSEVYFGLLEKIRNADPNDYDVVHDCVVEIFWHLDHIKDHIISSEKGFLELMRVLARKAQKPQKDR